MLYFFAALHLVLGLIADNYPQKGAGRSTLIIFNVCAFVVYATVIIGKGL